MVSLYVFVFVIIAAVQAQLISVHVIFRHGARAPILNVTSEEARAYFYRGLGQLTDEGVEQAKLIGKVLRNRYVNSFVDARMLPSQIYFRSSPVERCLMTAVTAGSVMFVNATPPIQTVPKNDDFLLVPKFNCDFQLSEWLSYFNLTDEEKKNADKNPWVVGTKALQKASALTKTLSNKSSENLSALILEKEAGLAVPSWYNEEAYKESIHLLYSALSVMSSVGEYHSTKGIRIRTGLLLNKIFTDIQNKVKCHEKKGNLSTSCEAEKLQVFSSHDLLILPLLEALNIREEVLGKNLPPLFLSTIIIETVLVDNIPYVKVLFRGNPKEETLRDVTGFIRNCPPGQPLCPVNLFTSCCSEFVSSDPKSECYEESATSISNEWAFTTFSVILLGVIFLLSILLILMLFLVIRYKGRSVVNVKNVDTEN